MNMENCCISICCSIFSEPEWCSSINNCNCIMKKNYQSFLPISSRSSGSSILSAPSQIQEFPNMHRPALAQAWVCLIFKQVVHTTTLGIKLKSLEMFSNLGPRKESIWSSEVLCICNFFSPIKCFRLRKHLILR